MAPIDVDLDGDVWVAREFVKKVLMVRCYPGFTEEVIGYASQWRLPVSGLLYFPFSLFQERFKHFQVAEVVFHEVAIHKSTQPGRIVRNNVYALCLDCLLIESY